MKSEEINLEALVAAVETELPEVEHFLDLRTGQILTIVGGIDVEEIDAAAAAPDEGSRPRWNPAAPLPRSPPEGRRTSRSVAC